MPYLGVVFLREVNSSIMFHTVSFYSYIIPKSNFILQFITSGNRMPPQQNTKDVSKKRYRRVKPQKSGASDGYGS